MSKLTEALDRNKLTLIVSLPSNSAELAKAAVDGGADAIKVHLNIEHAASGTKFGNLSEERAVLKDILDVSDVPVGIVPGDKILPTKEEMADLKTMGIDFFDIKLKFLPKWMADMKEFGRVVALEKDYAMDDLMGAKDLGVDGVEAAIVSTSDYGKDLIISDLQGYISMAISSGVPVIVPTQKSIRTSEVPIIADTGAKGLMIGAVVTGKTASSLKKATQAYRVAIDDLG